MADAVLSSPVKSVPLQGDRKWFILIIIFVLLVGGFFVAERISASRDLREQRRKKTDEQIHLIEQSNTILADSIKLSRIFYAAEQAAARGGDSDQMFETHQATVNHQTEVDQKVHENDARYKQRQDWLDEHPQHW